MSRNGLRLVSARCAAIAVPVIALALPALPLAGCAASVEDIGSVPTETLLIAGETGVGPINAATPASRAALEAALPGFSVEDVTMAGETSTATALAAFKDGLQVLQVIPGGGGAIGAVHVVTHHAAGPNGERIGMSFTEARQDASLCRPGIGNWRGMPICAARGAPAVTLVYSVPNYEATDHLPDPATMAGAALQRIVWTPGAAS